MCVYILLFVHYSKCIEQIFENMFYNIIQYHTCMYIYISISQTMYVSLLKFVWCFFPARQAEARFPCKVPGDGSGISPSFLRKTTHHHAFLVPGFQSIRKNLCILCNKNLESVCPLQPSKRVRTIPPPETNIFAPELWCLEHNPFLLGFGLCSGANHC